MLQNNRCNKEGILKRSKVTEQWLWLMLTEGEGGVKSDGLCGQESGPKQAGEVNALQRGTVEYCCFVDSDVEEGHGTQDVLVAGSQEPSVPKLGGRHPIKRICGMKKLNGLLLTAGEGVDMAR